jgi:hypothetical protein
MLVLNRSLLNWEYILINVLKSLELSAILGFSLYNLRADSPVNRILMDVYHCRVLKYALPSNGRLTKNMSSREGIYGAVA